MHYIWSTCTVVFQPKWGTSSVQQDFSPCKINGWRINLSFSHWFEQSMFTRTMLFYSSKSDNLHSPEKSDRVLIYEPRFCDRDDGKSVTTHKQNKTQSELQLFAFGHKCRDSEVTVHFALLLFLYKLKTMDTSWKDTALKPMKDVHNILPTG